MRRARVTAVTMARGNGKSAFAALIARSFLEGGPNHAPGREVLVVAQKHELARQIVRDVTAWTGPDFRVADNHREAHVIDRTGARVRAIGARPGGLHGMRCDLIIADELSQWDQADRMWAALVTTLGKRPGGRLLAVGTRPAEGVAHVFADLLAGEADAVLEFGPTPGQRKREAWGQRRTWRSANPSLDALPTLERTLRREWGQAVRSPVALARFQALRLNMGGDGSEADALLLAVPDWRRCECDADALPARDGPLGACAAETRPARDEVLA